MHEFQQNQPSSKYQVKSLTRDKLQLEESLLHREESLLHQLSGVESVPKASVQAQILDRISASQIAANPQLMLQMQQQFGNRHVSQVVQMAREKAVQGFSGKSASPASIQENKTGLPDKLKTGIENLSGIAMDDVRVHYNSSKPSQLNALAYARGTDIHMAPGQERHLPHEAWHVVQQMQGRVKPTTIESKGITVNEDRHLEQEADEMGTKANHQLSTQQTFNSLEVLRPTNMPLMPLNTPIQKRSKLSNYIFREVLSTYFDEELAESPAIDLVMQVEVKFNLDIDNDNNDFSEAYNGIAWITSELLQEEQKQDAFLSEKIILHVMKKLRDLDYESPRQFESRSLKEFELKLSYLRNQTLVRLAELFPYGLYSNEPDYEFWTGSLHKSSLAERLVKTPTRIKKALSENLDPKLWRDIRGVMNRRHNLDEDDQKQEYLQSQEQATTTTTTYRRTRGQKRQKLKGEDAGLDFIENVAPRNIEGTTPELLFCRERYISKEPQEQAGGGAAEPKPGYVLNMPAHTSKNVSALLRRYGSQATEGSPDIKNRMAAVIGINDRIPFDYPESNPVDNAIKEAKNINIGFPFGIMGFYWAPEFTMYGQEVQFSDVKNQYDRLPDEEAKKYVKRNFYQGRSGQKQLPYGLFREAVANDTLTNYFIRELSKVADPVYLHIGDPDAISWHSNNNKSIGILSRYDEIIESMKHQLDGILPPIIAGGYNFGSPQRHDSQAQALVRLGNIVDRAIRRSIADLVPEAMYPTEPNLLVKAVDRGEQKNNAQWLHMKKLMNNQGGLFGKKDSEGNALKLNLARVLERSRSDPSFAPYVDATIETDIPDRILESAGSHRAPLNNLLKQKQSYTTTDNWTGISRTDDEEVKAKAIVEKAIENILSELIFPK